MSNSPVPSDTISKDASVSRLSCTSVKNTIKSNAKTPYEKELERKLAIAEAELAFYKKCDEIYKKNKKK